MTQEIYQIQISLKASKPKIWRRILISSDLPLADFHKLIQTTMGWDNVHLHQFVKDDIFYTKKATNDDLFCDLADPDDVDYMDLVVSSLLKKEKDKMIYEYDFGDGWAHNIVLEKIISAEKALKQPLCLAGKGNCPPEDCGGIWGYKDILAVVKQPEHKDYNNYLEWLGADFDPEYFDKDEINEMLKAHDFGCMELY